MGTWISQIDFEWIIQMYKWIIDSFKSLNWIKCFILKIKPRMICSQITMATSLTNASNRARAEFSLNNDLYFSVCYSHKAIE